MRTEQAGRPRRAGPSIFLTLSAAILLASCARPKQPAKPLELRLQLARAEWRAQEHLWYLLEVKNVGYQPINVLDHFWLDQAWLRRNSDSKTETFFEIIGADGKEARPNFELDWGFHGESRFWANDTKDFNVTLEPGQVLRAAPSIIAPVRRNLPGRLVDDRDPPPGVSQERWLKELKKLTVPSGELLLERPASIPKEYRILEGYIFTKPGKYRMRAVYEALPQDLAEAEIRSGRMWLGGFPKETRIFKFESNWVEFKIHP